MISILGLSGSLRKDSYNSRLLRAAVELAPANSTILTKSIREVPIYDGDVEKSLGIPKSVQELKETLASSAGLLLVSPEYNNSLPGTLKNAIDWMTRPPADIKRIFRNKPVALIGASEGAGGTRFSQSAWLPVFRTLGMRPWFGGTIYLDRAESAFDNDGHLLDDKMKLRLKSFVEGFVDFINILNRGNSSL